jgi:hypothetical protein
VASTCCPHLHQGVVEINGAGRAGDHTYFYVPPDPASGDSGALVLRTARGTTCTHESHRGRAATCRHKAAVDAHLGASAALGASASAGAGVAGVLAAAAAGDAGDGGVEGAHNIQIVAACIQRRYSKL